MVDEIEGLLTLEELAKINARNAYNSAQKLLIKASRGKNLSEKEFVDVRNFLLTKFLLDKGTLRGHLNNASLLE